MRKRNHLKDCVFYIDNFQIIRYILNIYLFKELFKEIITNEE